MSGEPEVRVLADPDAVSAAAADWLVDAIDRAISGRGRADVATTGGSTPTGIYRALREPARWSAVDWKRVHLWFGDDRFVPRDHPLSNVAPVDDVLLDIGAMSSESGSGAGWPEAAGTHEGAGTHEVAGTHDRSVPLPPANVHPWPTSDALAAGLGAAGCADRYAAEVRAAVPMRDGWPVFDAALVGIGPDGHLLSVFPGSAAFDTDRLTMAIPAPTHVEPHVERVTFNPRVLDAATALLVVSYGAAKSGILATLLGPERDPRRWPAQVARRGGATWLLDEAAASSLPGGRDR